MNRHEVDGRLWELLVAIVTILLNQAGHIELDSDKGHDVSNRSLFHAS